MDNKKYLLIVGIVITVVFALLGLHHLWSQMPRVSGMEEGNSHDVGYFMSDEEFESQYRSGIRNHDSG